MRRRKANKKAVFLLSGVRLFVKHSELSEMTIQNEYGAISVVRDKETEPTGRIIGFQPCADDEQ